MNEQEQKLGIDLKNSWHNMYKESAWIFIGGLNYDLSEGDIIAVFSQYGEIVNINLVRDKKTGKQKGFCFLCYEDQKSTILAVDNLNGIKLLNRTIRVDHVANYKVPKEHDDIDDVTKRLYNEGCGPNVRYENKHKESETKTKKEEIKVKKEEKKEEKRDKKKRHRSPSSSSSTSSTSSTSATSSSYTSSSSSSGSRKHSHKRGHHKSKHSKQSKGVIKSQSDKDKNKRFYESPSNKNRRDYKNSDKDYYENKKFYQRHHK